MRGKHPYPTTNTTTPGTRTASGAAQALGNMGADGAEAVPQLAEAMRGTNIVLCRLAAKALSQIGPPALATLIAHLQHADPFVRGESALAIGWMGRPPWNVDHQNNRPHRIVRTRRIGGGC